jgi:hypothetical protein
VLLVLVLAMPRNPYIPVNLNVLKGQLATNELLRGHVGRLQPHSYEGGYLLCFGCLVEA